MEKINLISDLEAHLLVNQALDSTIESLKESPLQSIRNAAEHWQHQLGEIPKEGCAMSSGDDLICGTE